MIFLLVLKCPQGGTTSALWFQIFNYVQGSYIALFKGFKLIIYDLLFIYRYVLAPV